MQPPKLMMMVIALPERRMVAHFLDLFTLLMSCKFKSRIYGY